MPGKHHPRVPSTGHTPTLPPQKETKTPLLFASWHTAARAASGDDGGRELDPAGDQVQVALPLRKQWEPQASTPISPNAQLQQAGDIREGAMNLSYGYFTHVAGHDLVRKAAAISSCSIRFSVHWKTPPTPTPHTHTHTALEEEWV